jgi:hypothetical protein
MMRIVPGSVWETLQYEKIPPGGYLGAQFLHSGGKIMML